MFGDDRKVRFKASNAVRLLPFVGTDETRYYLQGIYVEPYLDGVLLVATNGKRLAMLYDEKGEASTAWICELPQLLTRACRNRLAKDIHFDGQIGHVTELGFGGDPSVIGPQHIATAYAPPIEGTFPNFREILPGALSANPSFTARREDFAAFGGELVQIFPAGEKTPSYVLLPYEDMMVGLISPARVTVHDLPNWYRPLIDNAPAKPDASEAEAAQ